jgi:hypothetical protein
VLLSSKVKLSSSFLVDLGWRFQSVYPFILFQFIGNSFFVIQLFFMVNNTWSRVLLEASTFSASQFSRLFMEAESLLPCVKASVSLHYPEPEEPISRHLILFL